MNVPRLAFAGDLTLTDAVLGGIRREGAEAWFADLRATLLGDVDGLVCNLEAIPADGGEAAPGKIVLRSSAVARPALESLSVLAVAIANNHIFDWGDAPVEDLVAALARAGIRSTGVSGIAAGGAEPARFEIGGRSLALVAFAHESCGARLASDSRAGALPLRLSEAEEQVRQLAKEDDWVVASLHGGFEQIPYPEIELRDAARRLARAGAALVVAHHPHVIRGVERVDRSWVAHGLGNFVTPDHDATKDGRRRPIHRFEANRVGAVLIVDAVATGRVDLHDVRFVRTANDGRSRVLSGKQASTWRRRLDALGTTLDHPDYEAFWSAMYDRLGRRYRLKLGARRLFEEPPSLAKFVTAVRLIAGRPSRGA